ncbi:hypothetical protein MAR_003333, partial [Mya arenaria]
IPVTNGSADETIPSEQVPKPSSASSQESLSEIQSLLDNLTLDISDEDLDKILELSDQVAEDQESIKRLSEMVYSKCVSDREFAKTGAFICDKLAALEINGTNSTAQARCTLLEVVECYCRGWKNLSNDVTRFYCDTMMDILTD